MIKTPKTELKINEAAYLRARPRVSEEYGVRGKIENVILKYIGLQDTVCLHVWNPKEDEWLLGYRK